MFDEETKAKIKEILKAKGLHAAEEDAKAAVGASFEILELLATKMSPAIGAVVVPVLELAKPKIMSELDKIDGVEG